MGGVCEGGAESVPDGAAGDPEQRLRCAGAGECSEAPMSGRGRGGGSGVTDITESGCHVIVTIFLSLSFFMSSSHNSRASLLAGLRTGGVRSAVQPSFSLPRYPSQSQPSLYPDDDFVDSIPIPLTAAVDGSNNRYALQQPSSGLNPNSAPFSPALFSQNAMQQNQFQNQQAIQRQLLQLEMMRIQVCLAFLLATPANNPRPQAVQAQQIQAELLAQAQRQQQQQQQQAHAQAQAQAQARERRTSLGLTNAPATAGPHITAFDLRSATRSAQMRRANQAEQLRAQLGLTPPAEDQVPMTAALGGRFGGRAAGASTHLSRFIPEESEEYTTQMSPTPMGAGASLASNYVNVTSNAPPSRSDQVSNWRRPGNNNVGLSHRAVSSPTVKITPPPSERQRISPPPGITVTCPIAKGRPQPLNIFPVASLPLATVAIDTTDSVEDDEASSVRSSSISSPTTPRSSSSSTNHESQLSQREEATKKLYEGLGIDRPVQTVGTGQLQHFHNFPLSHAHTHSAQVVQSHRMASQPTRQPRGPPSGADELGPKNFATRIRRQAIGGLGMLMGARERRESYVEAY